MRKEWISRNTPDFDAGIGKFLCQHYMGKGADHQKIRFFHAGIMRGSQKKMLNFEIGIDGIFCQHRMRKGVAR